VLILVGGIWATHGWNERTIVSQKKNTINAAKRECEANKKMIDNSISIIRNANESSFNFSYRDYKSNQISALLTSGLFDFEKALDILSALESYQEAVENFNASLRIVGRLNPGLFIKTELIGNKYKATKLELEKVISDKFRTLRDSTSRALESLSKEKLLSKI
ncbi:hypothetical protein ACFL1Z_08320, partial [Thermodesulfobacteriota bacterium]